MSTEPTYIDYPDGMLAAKAQALIGAKVTLTYLDSSDAWVNRVTGTVRGLRHAGHAVEVREYHDVAHYGYAHTEHVIALAAIRTASA